VPGHRHRDHHGKKGRLVFTYGEDEAALARARATLPQRNLRYCSSRRLSMFEETKQK